MKIRYGNTVKDIVAFGGNVCAESPTIRRKMLVSMVLAGVFTLLLFVTMAIILPSMAMLVGGIIGAPISMWMASSLFRDRVQASFRKIYSEDANKRLLGERELELTETSLRAKSQYGEGTLLLDAVEKVISTEKHTFIYVGTADAFVIPRAAVTEGDYDAFVEAVRQRVEARYVT